MKKKISGFEVALSAVACAFATIFMTVGVMSDFMLATGYIVGTFALMLPLAKGFILGDVLAYIATVILTLIFGGVSVPWRLVPFILFFGLHPLINYLQHRYHWNKYLMAVIKAVWFDVMLYLVWRFIFGMTTSFQWVDQYIIPVILIAGTVFFLVYDVLIDSCQLAVNAVVRRIKKD